MKRTRIMGLCLVAACAVFAVAATSAFALENLPHYGKCNKTAVGVGKYKNAGCKTRDHDRIEKIRMGIAGRENGQFHQRQKERNRPGGS